MERRHSLSILRRKASLAPQGQKLPPLQRLQKGFHNPGWYDFPPVTHSVAQVAVRNVPDYNRPERHFFATTIEGTRHFTSIGMVFGAAYSSRLR